MAKKRKSDAGQPPPEVKKPKPKARAAEQAPPQKPAARKTKAVPSAAAPAAPPSGAAKVAKQPEPGPVRCADVESAAYERHLVFDHVIDPSAATPRLRFQALARSVRDLLCQRWLETQQTYDRENPKTVYY